MAEKYGWEIEWEFCENKSWVMSRDRITENLVEFAKNSGLHPMKNSDKPKSINRFTCLVLHCRKKRGSEGKIYWILWGLFQKSNSGKRKFIKKRFDIKDAKEENLIEFDDIICVGKEKSVG